VAKLDAQLIHRLVEHEAALRPDALAVSADGQALSYGELNARANRAARHLRDHGVGLESRVAVALPRSVDFVVAALAVLKAGGVYVPIDPAYPEERRRFMLADGDAIVAIVDGAGPLAPGVRSVDLHDTDVESRSAADLDVEVHPENLAYIIYTSGSTGVPKGVAITHRDVVNLIQADPRLAVAPGDTVAHLAPTAFDASTFEIWSALARGGHVAALVQQQVSIEELGRSLRRSRPDWLFLTTGLFHLLVDHDLDALRSVGTLITGGDVLSPHHVRAAAAVTGQSAYAAYGPTETTVFASLHAIGAAAGYDRVPLGSGLAGKAMRILGPDLEELADGEVGEIYLGGEGLARGYHERPGLTADRFLPDPYASVPGARMYRTGDRGRRLPDGEVEFHGRVDRQVKVRGFRIELGEIEAALAAHERVAATAVSAVGDDEGGKRLVAYAAPTPHQELTTADLRAWVAQRLPAYMAPTHYVIVDELALDPNGKVDRTALPAPWKRRADLQLPVPVAPRTPTEELVAQVLADELGLDEVGRDDDFFELGGDSLRSVRVLEHLRSRGMMLSARQFFGHPTVAGLADLVAGGGDSGIRSRRLGPPRHLSGAAA
jgi:amino acid adenylation domain-containing protein